MTLTLRQAIREVQQLGLAHGFTIIIVGGALVRLIGQHTTIKKIDEKNKILFLEGAENPGIKRGEDKKTIIDIDAIAFSTNKNPFTPQVKADFARLQEALRELQKDTPNFPPVSIEPVLYHPCFLQPNTTFQFVSSVESDISQDYYFRLGSVLTHVTPQSLDFWTYVCIDTNEEVISLCPLAIQERYAIRGFSVKPKDKEKIWGQKSAFAHFVAEFTKLTKNRYHKDFTTWKEFEDTISSTRDPFMQLKKNAWNLYWKTFGTYLAHGTGVMGKILLPLGNTFFAGK